MKMDIINDQEDFSLADSNRFSEAIMKFELNETEQEIEKTVESIRKDSAKHLNDKEVLKTILSCIDLTSLKPDDSDESILKFVEKVNDFADKNPDLPAVAALCVYPCYAGLVNESLEADNIKIACVSGGFPSSQTFTEVKIAETSLALHDGADEIDIVQPSGRIMSGEFEYVTDETAELKSLCGDKILKVIIETGALKSAVNINVASVLAMYSGADFIKTSTGKEVQGATPMAAYVMCKAIKKYASETGRKVGFKAAGGIRTVQDAVLYYTIVEKVLGKEWLNNSLFRIGASSLVDNLIEALS
ncbi:MAG: deoxyribose-phosphate aldolase [Bacteroidaceae bacterium]|nr:deoxyribose-phosphate aldolase [Bacteroidaceae bacterium]